MNNDLEKQFKSAKPFNHIVIDDFFEYDIAMKLSEEFPAYDDKLWHLYDNPVEYKKTCNSWNMFPETTYGALSRLCSDPFIDLISRIVGNKLYADPGLHGGGWHIHSRGGKLNVHLDYDIHPKMHDMQRKLNLIVYLTPDWQDSWGGGLELWSHDDKTGKPKKCVKKISNKFNRAVLFDTTQNSWHGLPEPLNCPENVYRKSLATYYMQTPVSSTNRERALFAPYKDQEKDKEVLALIQSRVDNVKFKDAYVKK